LFYTGRTSWFAFFHSVIDSGHLAEMNTKCAAVGSVLLVVKSYINYKEGVSFPSIRLIAEKSGYSTNTILKALRVLVEYGYLEVKKEGRKNVYTAIERFEMEHIETGTEVVATAPYVPSLVQEMRKELQTFIETGSSNGKHIHIENLSINISNTQYNAKELTINNISCSPETLGLEIETSGTAKGKLMAAAEAEAEKVRKARK